MAGSFPSSPETVTTLFVNQLYPNMSFSGSSDAKEYAYNAGDWLDFWVGKIPWRKEWQPTTVFLPRDSHGQRRLGGYSTWGRKESDTTD